VKHVLSRLGGRGKKRQKASDASAAEPSDPVGGSDAADASVPPASAAAPVRSPFQVEIDGVADSAALRLAPPLEREGPVVFSRPLALHGSGTTIWGRGGPVVSIACSGVALHDLQIEAVAEAEASAPGGVALEVAPGCAVSFQRVVVRGDVRGLSGEEGRWRCGATRNDTIISIAGRSVRKRSVRKLTSTTLEGISLSCIWCTSTTKR